MSFSLSYLSFFLIFFFFFFNDTATTEIYTLSLHDALPICRCRTGLAPWHPRRSAATSLANRLVADQSLLLALVSARLVLYLTRAQCPSRHCVSAPPRSRTSAHRRSCRTARSACGAR